MDNKSNSENRMLSIKLRECFKNKIKFSLKTEDKVFIITKDDIFYEIDIFNENLINGSHNDSSIIEKMIVKELCHKQIIDLTCGWFHYIARTIDNKIYCWGKNRFGIVTNGREDNDPLNEFPIIKVNSFLSDLNINSIKCGAFHSLALTQNGELYAWGINSNGETGNGSEEKLQLLPIKVNGFNEEIIMISCGFSHSMALTKSGQVFSWGSNRREQLGIEETEDCNEPQLLNLEEDFIIKISCGHYHSLLLSKVGVIYAFGKNFLKSNPFPKDNRINSKKLIHEKRFVDITSHWSKNSSFALSSDNIFYRCEEIDEKYSLIPIVQEFKSFNEINVRYFGYNLEMTEELIEFSDFYFNNGTYVNSYKETEELGKGSFGVVVKVEDKSHKDFPSAIKKIKLQKIYKLEIFRELRNYSAIQRILGDYVVAYYNAWLEDSIIDDTIILYISMELCDKTLDKIIDEIESDSNMKNDGVLTPIGYYIASQLFIEIIEGMQHLHKHNIIHRDLNPNNIMLLWDLNTSRIIKIVDFGLIAFHEYAEQLHSQEKGTMKFIAPEVDCGQVYDTKADIFSLGIILQRLFDIYE
jgi:hypothetical protein